MPPPLYTPLASLTQVAQNYTHFQQLGFKTTLIVQPEGRVVPDLEVERLATMASVN